MKAAFLVNGPGEAWGWSRPLIHEAHRRRWDVDVHLLPCPYASGREFDALKVLPANICKHGSTLNTLRDFIPKKGYDAVLQLGGDLLFGRFLSWRQKAPLICYSYGRKQGMAKCRKVLTARNGLFGHEDLEVVGDLVLDSLDAGSPAEWAAPAGKRIAVFPGSRPNIRHRVFSLLQEIKKAVSRKDPQVELRVLLSPFAEDDEAQKWREAGFSIWTGTTPAGVNGADLALTQPGTNTIELMYLEQPFVVTIPYSFLRLVPLAGLVGLIDKIPWVGAALREQIIRKKLPHLIGKTAWPNRLVKDTFVPELIGEYSAEQLADEVLKILSDISGLENQKRRLHELSVEVKPGAPVKICDILERMAAERG